jgi:two-component system cell cycle response regulator DivK
MIPGKATILYVEDNAENRSLVRRVLESEGYTVREAANANQALASLQKSQPNLILMDINMPTTDGYALPNFKKIPIIAVTANVMRGDRERSLEAGCDGYIQKPIDIDTLTQQIERYLARSLND